jgi:hypothetical protein
VAKDQPAPKKGDLRVWHIPQVPMKAFYVPVANLVEAKLILDTLSHYDDFQLKNKIKPDYCNVNGLQMYDPDYIENNVTDSGWTDWHPDMTPWFTEACEKLYPAIYSGSDNLLDHHLDIDQVRAIVAAMT